MPRSEDDYYRRKRRKTSRTSRGHERKMLRALGGQSTSQPPAPICRLLALPVELLYHIMDALVSYRDQWRCERDNLYDPEPTTLCGALLNLALTCKKLLHVTLPRLYRRVDTYPYFGFGDAAPCLMRTLCYRPDLAAHMLELRVDCAPQHHQINVPNSAHALRPGRDWQVSPSEVALFNDEFRRHGITSNQLTLPTYRIDSAEAPLSTGRRTYGTSALGALAIVKAPNVRRLVLMTNSRTRLPPYVAQPGRLERLTELHWTKSDNYGLHSGAITLEDDLNWLTAAAPALRKVTIDLLEAVGRGVAPCPSVKELVLTKAMLSKTSMRRLGKVFPGLQRLTLDAEDPYARSHHEIVASLTRVLRQLARTYGGSLRSLRVRWDIYDDTQNYFCWPVQALASLRKMTALTELALAEELEYQLSFEKDDENHTAWRRILPPNLEVLRLEDISMQWFALPLLAAVDDVCGNMRTIIVDGTVKPQDDAELQEMIKLGKLRYEFRKTAPRPGRRLRGSSSDCL